VGNSYKQLSCSADQTPTGAQWAPRKLSEHIVEMEPTKTNTIQLHIDHEFVNCAGYLIY
jgi:hypothetical protein